MNFLVVPLAEVVPNGDQPRKLFDHQTIEELAQSIKANGLLQPILVRPRGGSYQIISGERRYRACRKLGLTEIPVVVRPLNDQDTLLAGLIENIQREDLNPVEEAQTLKRILLDYGLTHDQLAEAVGRSRSAITNRLRILQLPMEVQEQIATGTLSSGHAKMLAGLKDPHQILYWVKRILEHQLSVYETEKLMAQERKTAKPPPKAQEKRKVSANVHIHELEQNLQEVLGAKVRIRQGRTRGRIEIEFYDRDDLERVVETLQTFQFS